MNLSIISFALILFLIGSTVILFFNIKVWIKINKEIKEREKRIKEKREEFERIKSKGAR